MGIIHEFEEHKFIGGGLKGARKARKVDYYKTVYGNGSGIFDSIASVATPIIEGIKNNKDLIIEGGKAIGSVAGAAKAIADAKKHADELKEAEIINQIRNRNLEKKAKELSEATKEKLKDIPKNAKRVDNSAIGSGFHEIS